MEKVCVAVLVGVSLSVAIAACSEATPLVVVLAQVVKRVMLSYLFPTLPAQPTKDHS